MATREQIYKATILINSEQAQNNIAKLEKQLDEVKKRRDKALAEGKIDVWKAANKEIDSINKKLEKQRAIVTAQSKTIENISTAKAKELKTLIGQINKELDSPHIKKGSEEWEALVAVLKDAKTELREITEATREQESAWGQFTGFLNKNWGAITQMFGAVTGISATIRSAVNDYATMEEEMADVRKYTGLTAEKIETLNEKFKQMDTRTSREELNQLAGAAGRLGIQSAEQIEQFVKAADMIGVALGDDLGDGAVDKIGKLAMAFGEDERMGLQKAMLSTGSAINELAQNSSAKAGYLVDFTARVAGFGKQLGLTQAQIMGFGTVMDENLLKDEMAATAFGNMLTKMQTDTEKFARIAGMSVKDFTDLLGKDANAAILALADSLKRADPQNMMKMLDDMGLDGSRAVGVLSTLADKIDDVRRHQQRATQAYEEGISVEGEFNTMNNTVQAGIDKCKKRFKEMTVELGEKLMPVVKYTISGAGLLAKALSVLVTWFDEYKIAIVTTSATIAALVAWKQKDIIVTKLMTLANEKLWGSLVKLGKFMKTNWMGATITAVVALTTALWEMKRRADGLTESQRNLKKIQDDARKSIVEEEQKIRLLIAAAKDEKLSMEDRQTAVEKLNSIIPEYNAQLDETTGKYKENKEALDDYLSSLVRKYEIEGAKERLKELGKELADAESALRKAKESADNLDGTGPASSSQADVFFNIGQKVGANQTVSNAQKAKDKIQTEIDDLVAAFGEDLKKDAVEVEVEVVPEVEEPDKPTKPYKTSKEEQKEEEERKKRLKKAEDAAKAESDAAIAAKTHEYAMGRIAYREYIQDMARLQKEGLERRRDVYEKGSTEYERLNRKVQELAYKGDEQVNRMRLEELQRDMLLQQEEIEAQAAREEITEQQKQESLRMLNETFLADKVELYRKGTRERMDAEWELEQTEQSNRTERERLYLQRLSQYRKETGQADYDRLQQIELAGVETFYSALIAQGKMTQAEYDAIVEHIKRKYAELKAEQTANNDVQAKASKSLDTAKKNAGVKDVSAGNDAATGIFAVSQAVENQKLVNNQLKLLYGADYENNREYQEAKRQLDQETMQTIVAGAQAAYSTINSLMSAASSYAQACSDVEVAKITANYDKQIEAAGKNTKKKERLEKKKDEAIAKAKTKANKKAMAMEIAQAVAQTAMGAISAYSSTMAGAPYPANLVLAPISAGIALAAGALQIATIKKQHEAEAAGYYEGGFTGGTRYRREAGVVHEGEFVANHQAVNNPQLMPVFSLLDQAQRNNRVASLRAEDVTNVMGGPASQVIAPIVNVQAPDNSELQGTLEMVRETQDRLAAQLEQGIGVDIPIDGENGMYRRIKRYENLLKNK